MYSQSHSVLQCVAVCCSVLQYISYMYSPSHKQCHVQQIEAKLEAKARRFLSQLFTEKRRTIFGYFLVKIDVQSLASSFASSF